MLYSLFFNRKNKGFTLSELLVSVLIISILMVVLAPVITKRINENVSDQNTNKKGVQIYANPGIYNFEVPIGINTLFIQGSGGGGGGAGAINSGEINKSFTTSTTYTIPAGVKEIKLKITGSGGGGGGGNGTANSGTAPSGLSYTSCLSNEMTQLRGADDENDLCWTKKVSVKNIKTNNSMGLSKDRAIVYFNSSCTESTCCWSYNPSVGCPGHELRYCTYTDICKYDGAENTCYFYNYNNNDAIGMPDQERPKYEFVYRLPNGKELKKLANNYYYWSVQAPNALNLAMAITDGTAPPSGMPLYNGFHLCIGASGSSNCQPYVIWGLNKTRLVLINKTYMLGENMDTNNAFAVHCVRPLKKFNNYSGAGGASGAVLETTISVLPKDTFEITIGNGGNGGAAKTKGSQGGTTKVVHKRGGVELGTYYVKGGLGGNAATTNANGKEYSNGTSTNQTTPNGTCYVRNRKNTSDSFIGGNTNCSIISYSGETGTYTKGGNGGKVNNSNSINDGEPSSGGYLYIDSSRGATQRATEKEIQYAKGQDASTEGYGGGGGLTPTWAASASNIYGGGAGAKGKVEISYNAILPGGGGGSASRIGGVNADNEPYEIVYKVNEGSSVIVKIGSGGSGGDTGRDGLNGEATTIDNDAIVIMGGEGGKTANESDITAYKGGRGGYSSYINEKDNTESVATGVKVKNNSTTTFTIAPSNNSFKGENGKRGGVPSATDIQSGYTIIGTPFEYGFTGGMGASPFNISKTRIGAAIACGGGTYASVGLTNSLNYLCATGNVAGSNGKEYDAVNNEFGGSGGGGGGTNEDSNKCGNGGNGSNGYLRIRWDVTEQE